MGLLYDYHVLLTLGFVKSTRETVEKPRGVLAVKKKAFENTLGSMFSNRTL
jgi:hypothetical protein